MKTIYLVFNNREKPEVSESLLEDLKLVYGGLVRIKLCFLSEIVRGTIDDGDVFVVLYEDRVHAMREYISSLDRVIAMTRTIRREFLPEILAGPQQRPLNFHGPGVTALTGRRPPLRQSSSAIPHPVPPGS